MIARSTSARARPHDGDRSAREALAEGLAAHVAHRRRDGWHVFLLTFVYAPLPGGQRARLARMLDGAERFYRTFLTRAVRRPRDARAVGGLPVLIVAPDLPLQRRDRRQVADVWINDGLHLHGILLVPPVTRLRVPADQHLREQQLLYRSGESRLLRLDARPVDENLDVVVRYALKAVVRGRVPYDSLLVLPRALSELGGRGTGRRRGASPTTSSF